LPPPTETAEFEVKIRHESAEKAKLKYLPCVTSKKVIEVGAAEGERKKGG